MTTNIIFVCGLTCEKDIVIFCTGYFVLIGVGKPFIIYFKRATKALGNSERNQM